MQDQEFGSSKRLDDIRLESEQRMKNDPSHDFDHVIRVCKNAKFLCKKENIHPELVITAALLHDIIVYPKTAKNTKNSSIDSADLAKTILKKYEYMENEIKLVTDAIADHSYSSGRIPKTIQGKILQDADRLDALGAVGIARAFAVAGSEGRRFYNPQDPFCTKREPDDHIWTIDHFYEKLLHLEKLMNTESAKKEAMRRTTILVKYLKDLRKEIQP